jgi:hypothetical protein
MVYTYGGYVAVNDPVPANSEYQGFEYYLSESIQLINIDMKANDRLLSSERTGT